MLKHIQWHLLYCFWNLGLYLSLHIHWYLLYFDLYNTIPNWSLIIFNASYSVNWRACRAHPNTLAINNTEYIFDVE
jgi:hypothetical protein